MAFDINDVVTDPNKTPVAVKNTVQWYDATVASRYTCFVATADAGNGKVLAVRPDTGAILIAEWAAGNPFYATSTQIPAWHRLFFNAGTESPSAWDELGCHEPQCGRPEDLPQRGGLHGGAATAAETGTSACGCCGSQRGPSRHEVDRDLAALQRPCLDRVRRDGRNRIDGDNVRLTVT